MTVTEPSATSIRQADRFADLARALECDEDEARWDERLKQLAKANGGPLPGVQDRPPEDSA